MYGQGDEYAMTWLISETLCQSISGLGVRRDGESIVGMRVHERGVGVEGVKGEWDEIWE